MHMTMKNMTDRRATQSTQRRDKRQAMLQSIALKESVEECTAHAARSALMTRARVSGDVEEFFFSAAAPDATRTESA